MKKSITLTILLSIICLTYATDFKVRILRLSENVAVFSGGLWSPNVLAIAADSGMVVIDAPFSQNVTNTYLQAIQNEFGRNDFNYLINTYARICHIGGNMVFEHKTIIGHEKVSKYLRNSLTDTAHDYCIHNQAGIGAQWEILDINARNIERLYNYLKRTEEKLVIVE